MRSLWRQASLAAAVALASGWAAACVSPHYPIHEGEAGGPPPLSGPHPAYPIAEAPAAPAPAPPAAAPAAPAESAPLAAPTPQVESQPLPPPGPSASATRSGEARLQLASTASDPPEAGAPISTAPQAASPPVSAPPPVSATPPAAPPLAPAPSADAGLSPQMVVHDRASTADPAEAPTPRTEFERTRRAWAAVEPPRREAERGSVSGEVVAASGRVLESYEVQRGDHVDELARAFATSREEIVEANRLRRPYALRPGEILKVPVARAYLARGGETLQGVARRFSVNAGELAQLNHISERAALRPGEEIGLPSSMRDRGPVRVEARDTAYAEAAPRREAIFEAPTPNAWAAAHPYAPPAEHRLTEVTSSAPPLTPEHGAGYATPTPPAAAAEAALTDGQIVQAARGRFVWPVRGDIVDGFGPHGVGRRNDGVDIKAAQGTEVKAAAPGEVVYAGDQVPGFGNLVLIKHADGWVTAYAHLETVDVQMREQVAQGQSLGSVGTTGGVSQPELHFEVRYAPSPSDKARPVDPVLVLPVG